MNNAVKYLRVSLLNQCNLACSYCKPKGSTSQVNRKTEPEEYEKAIGILHKMGVRKVRFTGGEPTLYRHLPQLVEFAKSLSNDMQVAITSNGLLLDSQASVLADAGLDSVNISLDTVDPELFTWITGSDSLEKVMRGIAKAIEYIPMVKLNCVVMAGINDHQAESMIRFADSLGVDIRFIEFMPTRHSSTTDTRFVSGADLRKSLPYDLEPITTALSSAARYFRSDQLNIKVGFIDPVSHSFCAHCDRIRLASDGNLYGCLFSGQNFNLLEVLRQGDEPAIAEIHRLVAAKEYAGCSPVGGNPDDLPSFVNIGG